MKFNSPLISMAYSILGDSKMGQIWDSPYGRKIRRACKQSTQVKASKEQLRAIYAGASPAKVYYEYVNNHKKAEQDLKKHLAKAVEVL
jgi:hypothetical protein